MEDNPGLSLFQNGAINIENPLQNQEEAEELEDQIRRQEEIQNLLTVAMDDFNYDDSTINSSGNASGAEDNLVQKYKNSSMDDQLKVLYEVRVREVKSLSQQLENLKTETANQKDQYLKKIMLLEADKNQFQISLQQSQNLLVTKNDELQNFQTEIATLNTALANLQHAVKQMEEDSAALKHTNSDLHQQITMMQNGFTLNTVSERQIQEQHNAEVTQLHTSLDTALTRLDRKEKECKELEHKLKELVQEKDQLVVEKSSVINNLTHHLEAAQTQCQELIQTIELLSIENKKLKRASGPENSEILKTLNGKQELMKSLQKELEKSQNMQSKNIADFEKLQSSYSELHKKYSTCNEDYHRCKKELQSIAHDKSHLEKRLDEQNEELTKLRKQYDKSKIIEMEKVELERRVDDLENLISTLESKAGTKEHAVQVSQFLNHSNASIAKEQEAREMLQQELSSAYENVNLLKQELRESQEKISRKIELESIREKHIKDLQEKAAQFERIILEKKNRPDVISIGINTERDKSQYLEVKHAAEMVEKEVKIRQELKQEFENRLAEIKTESENNLRDIPSTSNKPCLECSKLKSQLSQYEVLLTDQSREVKMLKEQRQEDHNTIADILDDWKNRFFILESQNQQLIEKYSETKVHYDRLIVEMQKRDAEEAKMYAMIKKETKEAVKSWNRKTKEGIINFAVVQRDRINEAQSRIQEFSRNTEREIQEIEAQYRENRRTLEDWR